MIKLERSYQWKSKNYKENSEKCKNMLEIISEGNAFKQKSEEQVDDMRKLEETLTFKREEKEAVEFLFEIFKIYFFGPSSTPTVTFLN